MNPLTFISESLALLHMSDIGLSQFLDITILCTLIYYMLKWIRQTHAWALLKGFVIVVLVALIAYIFDLVTVIWLVQNVFAMGFVALVILFQPELRKALDQLGRGVGVLADPNKAKMISNSVVEIAQSVMVMSSRKVGALICIERDVSLEDISQTGILIDAVVTKPLIMNIFTNNTPLHDGAVIISNNRIKAATCILPLTSEEIDHELGTRHRAALGLSEVSDALVIIVSEETGAISVAIAGKLERHVSEKKLKKLLNAEMSDGKGRRRQVLRNKLDVFHFRNDA